MAVPETAGEHIAMRRKRLRYRAWHRADRTKIEVQVVHEDVATKAGFSPNTLRIGVG
jgi:hypothetical protein